ncbi:class F sortase [Gordonia rhizosphera]|uniref:Peptidase C60 family protein n=1 Tax=Gordonia rhizosphera NBRC 16068 TaxID=1108045 RepID=K6WH40_9ACTN|nr:class F sortase [Gordonia rhizosphera]GAB91477.1 peptidase C60 family protein [Gordonia rhizosphera NBRC 16068]
MKSRGIATALAILLAAAGVLLLLTGCGRSDGSSVKPAQILSGSTQPSSERTAAIGDPIHVRVPSVQIDAAVKPIVGSGDEIDPPTEKDAWWWTERGAPGSEDTVYLAGHAIHNGDGVFSPLHRVQPGAQIRLDTTAGTRVYRVDATATYDKHNLDHYDEVWRAVPGRLILVTCFVVDGRATQDNYLVYASLLS